MLNADTTARDYLADLLLDALIYRPGHTPLATLAELLPTELEIGPQFIETVLSDNPRFTVAEGSYNIAYRDNISKRPRGGAVETIVATYGRPMLEPLLANELARNGKGDLVFFEDIVPCRINFVRHVPRVDDEGRWIGTMKLERNDFGVMKGRPSSEPRHDFSRTRDVWCIAHYSFSQRSNCGFRAEREYPPVCGSTSLWFPFPHSAPNEGRRADDQRHDEHLGHHRVVCRLSICLNQ